jgi:ABC-type lipoprotein release transport system permease subunit
MSAPVSFKKITGGFFTTLSVGFFLAIRQVRRSSKATTILIISIMTLTFLNLVVIRGVLVGLIEGVTQVYDEYYSGDVFVSNLKKKEYIENSPMVISKIENLPWVTSYTARYLESGLIEADYKGRVDLREDTNNAGGTIAGIDPIREDATTNLSKKIVEGEFLGPNDADYIVLGSSLLKKYVPVDSATFSFLENVEPGTKVRITVGQNTREMTVKGIIQSKADEVDFRAYILDSVMRGLIGRTDYNVDEIAIDIKQGTDPHLVKDALLKSGVGEVARVQTAEEGLPKFVIDIKNTFGLLGNVVGSIGLVVASITIFIVIFINAITRRKYIGILKGIGIDGRAIEFAYVLISIFYAIIGVAVGLLILYGFLVPFINAHPIKFPFSDGILVAEIPNTALRAVILMLVTLIAGYIPARMVVKQNTLDAILGRGK